MNSAEFGLVFMASLLIFCATWSIPFKRDGIWIRLSLLLVIFGLETCVLLIQRFGVAGKFAATILELLGHFILVGIYCKGIIWKNYLIFYIVMQCANILMAIETAIIPSFAAVFELLFVRAGQVNLLAYVLMISVKAVETYLVAHGFRKLMKPEVLSGANVYRTMTLILMILVGFFSSVGHEIVDEKRFVYADNRMPLVAFWITFTIIWLLVLNLIAYIYNRAEKKRVMNRRALIEKLADDNYNHYRDLARSNDELKILYSRTNMFRDVSDRDKIYAEYVNNLEAGARDRYEFSLSGCLAVDSLLYEYSEKAKAAGVSFSAVLEPFELLPISMQDAAAIVEYLMEGVFARVTGGHRSDAWIMLDWRMRRGMMIIVLAYHGAEKKRFSRRNIEFVRDIVSMHYGVVQTIREDEEDQIRLFIPSQNDNNKETEDTGLAAV